MGSRRGRRLATRVRWGLAAAILAVPATATAHHVFDDVDDGRFYAEPVEWAFDNNITTGRSDTIFDPSGAVTRGEAVTFLKRYHDNIAVYLDTDTDTDTNTDAFADIECEDGQALGEFDGTWQCADVVLQRVVTGWDTHEATDAGFPGYDSAVAINDEGHAIIAHSEDTGELEIYSCSAPDCSTGTNRTATAGTDDVGADPSIAIGHDGNPIIAHQDSDNERLRIYVCTAPDCSTGSDAELYAGSDPVGFFPSIAIRNNGRPLVAHFNQVTDDLELFVCADTTCSGGTNRVLASDGEVGFDPAMAIGHDGNAVIAHHDDEDGELHLYVCSTADCSSGTNRRLVTSGDAGRNPSIAIGADGNPIIAHIDGDTDRLNLYMCSAPNCSSGTNLVLGPSDENEDPAVTIGADGYPIVASFAEHGDDLALYVCTAADCSTGTGYTPEGAGVSGKEPAIAVTPAGDLLISHRHQTTGFLLVTHVRLAATGLALIEP